MCIATSAVTGKPFAFAARIPMHRKTTSQSELWHLSLQQIFCNCYSFSNCRNHRQGDAIKPSWAQPSLASCGSRTRLLDQDQPHTQACEQHIFKSSIRIWNSSTTTLFTIFAGCLPFKPWVCAPIIGYHHQAKLFQLSHEWGHQNNWLWVGRGNDMQNTISTFPSDFSVPCCCWPGSRKTNQP